MNLARIERPDYWFRHVYRVPRGDETPNEPIAGWWLSCWPDFCAGGCEWEKFYGPFDSMDEALQFRDGTLTLQ